MKSTRSALDQLSSRFALLGVPTDSPGFYDHPRFLSEETKDPSLLERYAEYVIRREYDSQYLTRARLEIPLIADIVRQELVADGRLGACVDIGMILSRILEREGYWNAMIKGSLTIVFPAESGIRKKLFYSYDLIANATQGFAAAHAWIIAPPFDVVDVAAQRQPYEEGTEYVPSCVLAENATAVEADPREAFSPEYLQAFARKERIPAVLVPRHAAPGWRGFLSVFMAREVTIAGTCLRYIPVGVGAPDCPFEEMNNWKVHGRLGKELYKELVKPALAKLRAAGRV